MSVFFFWGGGPNPLGTALLTIVLESKESDGSVVEQTGKDFFELPSKQRKNPDRILLHVPRNIASTSQVVMTADRHKISSNALNDIIASIIRESQGCVKDFVLSQISTVRGRKKLRSLKFESVRENFSAGLDDYYFTIQWDEKLLKCGKAYTHKEHIAVLPSSTNGKLVKLLGITDLDSGTGLNQAKAVKNMVEEWIIEQRCVAMCFDTINCIQHREVRWSMYSIGSSYRPPITVDIMPSPYAVSHSGRCLRSNIRSF